MNVVCTYYEKRTYFRKYDSEIHTIKVYFHANILLKISGLLKSPYTSLDLSLIERNEQIQALHNMHAV